MSETILLFTDWDGVLVHPGFELSVPEPHIRDFFNAHSCDALDPISFGILNRLFFDTPDLHMVCSSTWRPDGREAIEDSLKNAHEALRRATNMPDLPYAIRFHDIPGEPDSWRTDMVWEADHPRGNGIDMYLKRYCSEDQKYLILDDDPDFHAHHMPFLVQTNAHHGMSVDEYIKIQEMVEEMKAKPAPAPSIKIKSEEPSV